MPEKEPPRLDPEAPAFLRRLETVKRMTPDELDALPFGVIKVDREGLVLAYNESEARLARRKPEEVIGRNFFTQVAPCTNVREFAARFRDGVTRGKLHVTFPFVFTFPNRPVNVMVTIAYESPDPHAWIFVDQDPGKDSSAGARR
jgi:chemotaxis family two-component system sensor kinase Cph1